MAVGLVAVSVNWTRLPSSSSILSPQYTTLPFNLRDSSGSSENFSPRSARISAIFALLLVSRASRFKSPSSLAVLSSQVCWVAVKELKLRYYNGCIYLVNNRVSPI